MESTSEMQELLNVVKQGTHLIQELAQKTSELKEEIGSQILQSTYTGKHLLSDVERKWMQLLLLFLAAGVDMEKGYYPFGLFLLSGTPMILIHVATFVTFVNHVKKTRKLDLEVNATKAKAMLELVAIAPSFFDGRESVTTLGQKVGQIPLETRPKAIFTRSGVVFVSLMRLAKDLFSLPRLCYNSQTDQVDYSRAKFWLSRSDWIARRKHKPQAALLPGIQFFEELFTWPLFAWTSVCHSDFVPIFGKVEKSTSGWTWNWKPATDTAAIPFHKAEEKWRGKEAVTKKRKPEEKPQVVPASKEKEKEKKQKQKQEQPNKEKEGKTKAKKPKTLPQVKEKEGKTKAKTSSAVKEQTQEKKQKQETKKAKKKGNKENTVSVPGPVDPLIVPLHVINGTC